MKNKNASNEMYEHISSRLSQGMKIAIPQAILDQENLDLDDMNDYFVIEKGSFGLINFTGFRKAL